MIGAPDKRKPVPHFGALKAFEVAGRLGGIRRAAQALELDHAAVSRHLRSLEEWAGIPLINRSRGEAFLTDEGARYHARISAAFVEITNASAELTRRADERKLSIWCVPGFASQWLAGRLGAFQEANPDLDLELHPTDGSPDFSRYEADADIRYIPCSYNSPIPAVESTSIVRRFEIARPPVLAVASPACAALLPMVRKPEDLLQAPLLHEENQDQWHTWFASHGVDVSEPLRGPRLWHAHLTLDAARRGHGVALANAFLLGDDFASRRLVPLAAGANGAHQAVLGSYVFAARADRWQSRAIVRFRNWLKSASANQCDPAPIANHLPPLYSGREQPLLAT